MTLHQYTCVAVCLIVLAGAGCKFMRVDRDALLNDGSPSTGGGPLPRDSGSAVISLSQNTIGFSSSGGIARSKNYLHFSDPSGFVSSSAELRGGIYQGAVGVNPSEMVPLSQ